MQGNHKTCGFITVGKAESLLIESLLKRLIDTAVRGVKDEGRKEHFVAQD
jgi:hypothetical protein